MTVLGFVAMVVMGEVFVLALIVIGGRGGPAAPTQPDHPARVVERPAVAAAAAGARRKPGGHSARVVSGAHERRSAMHRRFDCRRTPATASR